jgi:chorismate mutase
MPRAKLAKLSVEDLKKEIIRRQKALPKLIHKRDQLSQQIAELQALGAAKPATKRGRKPGGKRRVRRATRAARPGSLASALVEALKANVKLTLAQAVEAVRMAGYKSKSKNFRTVVGMALSKDEHFRRVRRGEYTLNR